MQPFVIGLTCEPSQGSKKRFDWMHEFVSRADNGMVIVGPNYKHQNWQHRGFPIGVGCGLTPGEICCNITHLLAYHFIIKTDTPAILIEDDVDFIEGKGYNDLLDLRMPDDADVIKLSLPLLLPDNDSEIIIPNRENVNGFRQQELGTWGTEALYMTPSGAKKLIEKNTPMRYAADVALKWSPNSLGMKLYQINDPIFIAGKFESFIRVNTEIQEREAKSKT